MKNSIFIISFIVGLVLISSNIEFEDAEDLGNSSSETGSAKSSILETIVEPEPAVEETPEPVGKDRTLSLQRK